MEVTLPVDLAVELDRELSQSAFKDRSELIEVALRRYLAERRESTERLAALDRLADLVDAAGLYEKTLVPER
ncbi:MAG: hypothetical protein JST65_17005 [Acidobacteria bacterium]|nr:hypothetical protein [Acidobacteriota bacterium]